MSRVKRINWPLALFALISCAASGQSSRWTRTQGGAVIDLMDLKPSGDGYLIELREGEGRPVYSSGFCIAPGPRVICSVKWAKTNSSGMVALDPLGSSVGYRSLDINGGQSWTGNFQLVSGALRGGAGTGAGLTLGSASRWTRTANGAIVDVIDLSPRGDGAAAELREGPSAPVYSRGFCLSSGDAAVCSIQGIRTGQAGLVLLKSSGAGLSYKSWNQSGAVTWTGAFDRAGSAPAPASAAASGPSAPALFSGVKYQVENFPYNNPDAYGGKRNLHDFIVDWSGCRVRNVSAEADAGLVSIKVHTCRPQTRLTFTTTHSRSGAVVDYDWVIRDSGKTVFGAYRQGSSFGVSAGAIR